MRVAVSAFAIVTLAVTARADTPPLKAQHDRTKIVRIERPRGASATFMFCDIRGTEGNCIGPTPPHVGEKIDVVDDTQRVAQLRITSTQQRDNRDSACAIMWNVQYEVERGSIENAHGQLTGVIGAVAESTGHRLNGSGNGTMKIPAAVNGGNDESVLIGVDLNGDNELDYALTLYSCSNAAQPLRYGGNGSDFCVNVWSVEHEHYTRIQQITSEQLQPCLH